MRSASLRFVVLPLASVVLSFFFTLPASADTTCTNPGDVPITDATRAAATAADIPTNVNCWNPNNPYAGVDTGQAKADLAVMRCSGNVNTTQLDGKFSVCADRFMKQLRQQISPSACINSAYRSYQEQINACMGICHQLSCPGLCAPPGKSYHQFGLAIDIGGVSRGVVRQFWQTALQNGIGNPNGLHGSDPFHIQAMNGGQNCAGLPYLPTNDDIFMPGPPSNNPYFGYGPNPLPSMQPPSSPVGTPSQTTPASPSQTQSCTQSFACSANVMYQETAQCTTQVYQTCFYGCNSRGTACNTSPANASSTNATSSGSSVSAGTSTGTSNTNSNSNGSPQSVSDILNSIIGGSHDLFTATDIGTSAPLTLNPNTHQIGTLQPGSTQYPAGTVFASGTITSIQPVGSQSTFISQDLGNAPAYAPAQNNFAFSILESMKQALLSALNFLRSLVHG